jgi:hypothetical protein
MSINRGNFPRLLLGEIKRIFGNTYPQLDKVYPKIFEVVSSAGMFEDYQEITGLGLAAVKGEGAALAIDSMKQGLTERIQNVTYGKALKVTKESIEDNRYGRDILRMTPELAKSIAHAQETTAANVLNRAFNNSYLYADGQPLCDTDKVVSGTGETYANKPSVAVDLSEAALEQAIIDIEGIVGSDGLRIDIEARDLIIPRQLKFEAHRILKSMGRVATADNDANALKDMSLIKGVQEWRFLTDTDAWFIRTTVPGGLIFQERLAPEFGDDNEFLTTDLLYRVRARWGVGSENQRGIYGSAGA